MSNDNQDHKPLSEGEIGTIISSAKKPGLRFTLDLYLLDYVKNCLLEDDQLSENIRKLQALHSRLENDTDRKDVTDVIKSLQCVEGEYKEYLEDIKTLADGGYPASRGTGQ